MTHTKALSVEHISKRFATVQAVDGVSFEAHRGEILGLLGPNGAGKSTAIRMVMGIFLPDSGRIRAHSDDGSNQPLNQDRIGYLPEERGVYDDAKVLDTLVYFAGLKGVKPQIARPRALEWLERLDLADWANQNIEKLSKGMTQKVQFIASILHQPELAVLDEPFSGLDPVNQDVFKDIILELKNQGMAVLLSAHQMNVVEELCDRIFMINKGRRVLYGPLNEVKENFGEHNVRVRFEGDGGFLQQNDMVKDLTLNNGHANCTLPKGVAPDRFIKSLPAEITIDELVIERPPLHDIFVSVVKGDADAGR